MKKTALIAITAGLTAAMAALTAPIVFAQATQDAPPYTPAAPDAYQSQAFAPGFDDLMTMLVQPRHTKLWYAGAAKNWELAAAESRDLRSSFGRIVQTIPTYEGNDVGQATAGFLVSKLDAVDQAVAAADPKRFAAAYKDLTAGCNACHTYMEHPFLVIRIPAAPQDSAHPDQDFKPIP